jgi:hypothetical protein
MLLNCFLAEVGLSSFDLFLSPHLAYTFDHVADRASVAINTSVSLHQHYHVGVVSQSTRYIAMRATRNAAHSKPISAKPTQRDGFSTPL